MIAIKKVRGKDPALGGSRLLIRSVKWRFARRLSPIYLAISLAADCASAAVHYVDIDSTNPLSPFLSWETAATNIQKAINVSQNGDTVLVADGTYNITSQIMVMKSLTLRSVNGPSSTIINANHHCRGVRLKAHRGSVTFEGFSVTGGYVTYENYGWSHGGGIAVSGQWPVLIGRCIIEGNEADKGGGGINITVSNEKTASIVVENCLIRNNRSVAHGGGLCIGAWQETDNPVIIRNCTIVGNRDSGSGSAISLVKSKDLSISEMKIINCIIYGNKGNEIRDPQGEIKILHCCMKNAPVGEGNIKSSPLFMDEEKRDFRLQLDSPCVEAGSNEYVSNERDLAGNPRIMDADLDGRAVVDMGAYEYVTIPVEIDIRPGSRSNVINIGERGLLPVAILTTEFLSVEEISPSSIRFAQAKPERRMLQDVDGDGDVDLLLLFPLQDLKLYFTSTRALLTGRTRDQQPFIGMASIKVLVD